MQAFADGRKIYDPEMMTLQEFFDDYWEPDRNAKKEHPEDDRSNWGHYYKDKVYNRHAGKDEPPAPLTHAYGNAVLALAIEREGKKCIKKAKAYQWRLS